MGMAGSLERFAADIYETASAAISEMAADLEDARSGIVERDRRISDLERQLAVHEGWNRDGRKDGNAPREMTRAEYRLASARFEAARSGGDPGSIKKRKPGRNRATAAGPAPTAPRRPSPSARRRAGAAAGPTWRSP